MFNGRGLKKDVLFKKDVVCPNALYPRACEMYVRVSKMFRNLQIRVNFVVCLVFVGIYLAFLLK